jgi:hypothetical protein
LIGQYSPALNTDRHGPLTHTPSSKRNIAL